METMLIQLGYTGPASPWAYYFYGIILLVMAFGLALNLEKPEKSD